MNRNSTLLPVLGIVIAAGIVAFGWNQVNRIPENEFPMMTPEYTLQGSQGTVRLSDFRGKVGMLFFGYAHCPDVCPSTMVTFGQVLDMLDEKERTKVSAQFISLDPERDSPEVMTKYVNFFHPGIIGLSGNSEQITAAAKSFLIAYEQDKANAIGNYSMNHSTYIFIVRPDGHLGRLMSHQSTAEEIAAELRYWMKWAD